ncbi:retrovirus-related pol polyprotein from transposon TNT 1-94 [Tanacetum coccineum]
MKAVVQQYHVDKQCFEIKKKQFLIENDQLLDQIISQDIVNIVVNSSVIMNDSVNYEEMCNKCLELEDELIKQHNMVKKDEYNRLSKRFFELEQHCISLEITMQLNKEIFQKTNTSVNQTEPSFDQLFELNNLKAELQAKHTTIKKLKAQIKRINETSTSENVKKYFDEIKTINIELEHRVTRLIAENEHLKQTYKQLYDSIKPSRVRAKEQTESLVNQVNQKSVEISDLNAQLQEKVFVITTLKNDLRKLKGKDIVANAAQMSNAATIDPEIYKLDPVILAHKVKNNREAAILRELIQELLGYVRDTCPDIHKPSEKLVAVTPINKKKIVQFVDIVTSSGNIPKVTNRPILSSTGVNPSTKANRPKPSGNTKNDRIPRTPNSNEKNKVEVQSRKVKSSLNKRNSDSKNVYNKHVKHLVIDAKGIHDKSASKKNKRRKEWKPTGKVFNSVGYKWKPTGRSFTIVGNACPLTRITTINKVPLKVPIPLKVVAPKHVVTRVHTRRPKVPKSVQNSKPKVVKSITANRMELGTSQGSNTSVDPSSSLTDCRLISRNYLYSLSIGDMMASSPICLLLKATKTKSWLWHRRLSHLNFGAINHLARHSLVRGLPRLKFEKDHLCSTCAMGNSKKQSHKPKSEDTNQEKLYLLHMDFCRPMRVASVNGKKYILVIMDDYSRFTWVKFLASKDQAPDFIIKFLKMIQVRLNATVRNIRTDNETKFVNQISRDYYEQFGISHETSVARTQQQNGVVERRNHTLVEAAHTMLIFAQAPLFLWVEAIATACYTQNRSIIHRRHGKVPYELLHDRKPDLSYFHVFCALCYPNNDSENLGKLQAKADIADGNGFLMRSS